MDQYLLIPFLGGWTSIYQLIWCSPGVQGFDTLPDDFHTKSSMSFGFVGPKARPGQATHDDARILRQCGDHLLKNSWIISFPAYLMATMCIYIYTYIYIYVYMYLYIYTFHTYINEYMTF